MTMVPIPRAAARRPAARIRIAAAALLVGGLLATAVPSRAAGSLAAVPEEPGAMTLTTPVYAALVADVNGDGIPDLVVVVPASGDPTRLAVRVWGANPDGTWYTSGEALLRRGADRAGQAAASPAPGAGATVPLHPGDGVRLLAWHVGSRTRILAVTSSATSVNGEAPCCLTIWEVSQAAMLDTPRLTELADTGRGAVAVVAADLDGDGVDELIVREPPDSATTFQVPITVLHWTGGAFVATRTAVSADDPGAVSMWILGDSDGRPGVEIGLEGNGSCFPWATWKLTRLAERDGSLHTDSMCLDHAGTALAVPNALGPGSPGLLYGDTLTSVSTISWPAGSPAHIVSTSSFARRGRPVAVLGGSANPWVVLESSASGQPVIELDRPTLGLTSARGLAATAPASLFVDSPMAPYVGPWPAPTPGAPGGFLFEGTLAEPRADGAPRTSPVAMLAGAAPIGIFGPGGVAMALLRFYGPGGLVTDADTDPAGGTLGSGTPHLVSLVPLATVMTPEENRGILDPGPVDAVADPSASDAHAFLAGSRTFRVSLSTPAGSLSAVAAGGGPRVELLGLPALDGRTAAADVPPFHVPISGPSGGGPRYQADLYVATPAGHGYRASFAVRVVSGAPSLAVGAGLFSLGFSARVSGSAVPASRVTVDGTEVPLAADGTFTASVPAGLIPRSVTVVAADPFGHLATATVSVLAPLDYRRLPWIPIIAALTVAAAAVLFLRGPRPARPATTGSEEDGVVEEMDLD